MQSLRSLETYMCFENYPRNQQYQKTPVKPFQDPKETIWTMSLYFDL